ncbi:MAG: hypothetical protein QOF57_1177 [Frankiaceae bacterium]|jgi:hypothetical protein|nr:hypothetical protein [Frankiaceae bacterium]
MSVLDDVGIALLLVSVVSIALIVRRLLLRRGGAVLDLCVRPRGADSHWVLGLARYSGDTLQWFRILGLSACPSRSFRRDQITVVDKRIPSRREAANFVHGAVVLQCVSDGHRLDLALPETAINGFQAWLEALPPGSAAPRPEAPDTPFEARAQHG